MNYLVASANSLSTSDMFFFRKISMSTNSGLKEALVGPTMSPAVENDLSDATEDPCVGSKSFANAESRGYLDSDNLQNNRGSQF